MSVVALALTIVGTIATALGTYFAWVAVRRSGRRTTFARYSPASRVTNTSGGRYVASYDLFISYSRNDLDWVNKLVARLTQAGLRVALDQVVLKPGSLLVHSIEQAIRDSAHGLLVFSPASVVSGWVEQEYVTLMGRSIERKQLFIPVLIGEVVIDDLPEFARTRYFADFRHVSEVQCDQLIADIVMAVRKS